MMSYDIAFWVPCYILLVVFLGQLLYYYCSMLITLFTLPSWVGHCAQIHLQVLRYICQSLATRHLASYIPIGTAMHAQDRSIDVFALSSEK